MTLHPAYSIVYFYNIMLYSSLSATWPICQSRKRKPSLRVGFIVRASALSCSSSYFFGALGVQNLMYCSCCLVSIYCMSGNNRVVGILNSETQHACSRNTVLLPFIGHSFPMDVERSQADGIMSLLLSIRHPKHPIPLGQRSTRGRPTCLSYSDSVTHSDAHQVSCAKPKPKLIVLVDAGHLSAFLRNIERSSASSKGMDWTTDVEYEQYPRCMSTDHRRGFHWYV